MKTLSILAIILTASLLARPVVRAQDAASEERYNKLVGQIEDLLAARNEQNKRIAELAREIESYREQATKPQGNYASQEDLRRLAEQLKEVDKNREHDKELILKEIAKLGKTISTPTPVTPTATPSKKNPPTLGNNSTSNPKETDNGGAVKKADKTNGSEQGYDYFVKSGDTLSTIAQAYREQNIKVTTDQILKANPGLKPEKMRVGQKIFIPAPQA
jgi:LysM repeat protein